MNARLKWNLTALGTYTWAKSITRTGTFNDWTNLGTQKALDVNSIPQALSMNLIYQTPHVRSGILGGNKVMRQIFSDWQVSAVMRYQSGALITAPGSNNNLGTYLAGASTQYMARVPGQPLYLADPNGKIDPTKQLLLNPAAWTECGPTATFGCGAPRYTDFRQRRSPQEDIGLGRRFVLSGKEVTRFFEIRMEMYNPFNRIVFPNIGVGNPITSPTRNSNGLLTRRVRIYERQQHRSRDGEEHVGGGEDLVLSCYRAPSIGVKRTSSAARYSPSLGPENWM